MENEKTEEEKENKTSLETNQEDKDNTDISQDKENLEDKDNTDISQDKENLEDKDEEIKKNNQTLKKILLVLGICFVALTIGILLINSSQTIEYKGIEFKKHKNTIIQGKVLYSMDVPFQYKGEISNREFFLRTNPKNLEKIPLEGEVLFAKNIVINMSGDFNCDGYGIIAITNLANLYNLFGAKVINDINATCDEQGRYMFLQIEDGKQTKIVKDGPLCYTLYVNNCEILEVTEKMMVETLTKLKEE